MFAVVRLSCRRVVFEESIELFDDNLIDQVQLLGHVVTFDLSAPKIIQQFDRMKWIFVFFQVLKKMFDTAMQDGADISQRQQSCVQDI